MNHDKLYDMCFEGLLNSEEWGYSSKRIRVSIPGTITDHIACSGYGYKDKIPAMDIEERQGIDLMNENVHNNFVNIFARGGLIQLFLFLSFYYFVVSTYKEKHGNYNILIYILPILFCAFFDAAMENAHFPLLYYFFLGRLYIKEY